MTYYVNLKKQGLHEFVLTILPRSLFNNLIVLSCSSFSSKLFFFPTIPLFYVYVFGQFVSSFGCSQLNHPWQTLECSFDVVNLYPSVPINEAVAVIIEILNNAIDDLQKRMKLILTDIHKLIELFLGTNYFVFENCFRNLENSGPISLALTVAISKSLLQHLEDRAMQETLVTNLALLSCKRYFDDSHARFETVHQSHSFLNILNKQNQKIRYRMEKEDQSMKIKEDRCNHKH